MRSWLLFENQTMFERAPHGFSEFLYELDAQNEHHGLDDLPAATAS